MGAARQIFLTDSTSTIFWPFRCIAFPLSSTFMEIIERHWVKASGIPSNAVGVMARR